MSKGQQTLRLRMRKDYFEAYLRNKFNTQQGEPILIDRKTALGKFIHAHAKCMDYPTLKSTEGTTEISLSNFRFSYQDFRYFGFAKDDVEKINDFIEAQIELDTREMIVVGLEMGYTRKHIISTFIVAVLGSEKYEMIKKDDYRRRLKIEKLLTESKQLLSVQ